jgi:hypothetical protein
MAIFHKSFGYPPSMPKYSTTFISTSLSLATLQCRLFRLPIAPKDPWLVSFNIFQIALYTHALHIFQATLFTKTDMLTFTVWSNGSYFCNTLRPQSPLPPLNSTLSNYCPLGPGPFAFSSTITLPAIHDLATFNTRLRAVDPYQQDLFCIAVATTPLKPDDSAYGKADIIFWITVATAISYWLLVGLARIVSAWGRGLERSTPGLWHRLESAGFIFASALSGEKLAASPALLRFCTPSLRDIIFHTQWCAALGMVAVRWPQFICEFVPASLQDLPHAVGC